MRTCILLLGLVCIKMNIILAQAITPEVWSGKIIKDAENPTPKEISGNLIPVTENNKYLFWDKINREKYVKVVSYKTENVIKDYKNDSTGFYQTGEYYIWVTMVPEIKDFCMGLNLNDSVRINRRLRQRLGLLPNDDQNYFVEFWVKPEDLFRPCPDNEIDDTKCGLCLSGNVESWYRKWFNELRAVQYTNGNKEFKGYPWTQLGYTYDWNAKNKGNRGVSEFVIKINSSVKVINIYTTAEYCIQNK